MKTKILIQHAIKAIELPNGVIIAEDDCGTLTDITNFSIDELYKWLGY